MAQLLSSEEITTALAELPEWGYAPDAGVIYKRYSFQDFKSALAFTNKLGELAEEADHHPDLKLGWGYTEVALTTHDAGGITNADVTLAQQADRLDESA